MADDVAAWLDGRRVGAHDYSTWELVKRLVAAWRVPLAITLVALIAIGVALGFGFAETAAERDRAQLEEARASAAEGRAKAALAQAEHELGRAQVGTARVLAESDARPEAELTAATALKHDDSPEARGLVASLFASTRPTRVWSRALPRCHRLQLSRDAQLGLCNTDSGFELWDLERGERRWRHAGSSSWSALIERPEPLVLYETGSETLTGVVDGRTGATRAGLPMCCLRLVPGRDGVGASGLGHQQLAVLHDVAAAPVARVLPCPVAAGVFEEGPHGERWIAGCSAGGYAVALDGGDAHVQPLALGIGEHITAVAFVPDSDQALLGTNRGELLLIVPRDGRILRQVTGGVGVISALSVSRDGRVAVVRDEHSGLGLWDLVSGAWRGRLPAQLDHGMRWLDDQPRRLATWGASELVTWDVPIDRPAVLPIAGGASAIDIVGERLAVAAGPHAEVFDLQDGARIASLSEGAIVKSVALDRDAHRLAIGVAATDRGVAIHGLDTGTRTMIGAPHFVRRVARLAGDQLLRVPDWGPITVSDWAGDASTFGAELTFVDASLSASARFAALLESSGKLIALSFEPAPMMWSVAEDVAWDTVAPGNDGELFACGTDGGVELVDRQGDLRGWLAAERDVPLIELAWSPDDHWLAAGGKNGAVYLWSVADRTLRAVVRDHRERVAALAFDASGAWLASGGWDATVSFIALAPIDKKPDELLDTVERAWGLHYEDSGGR